MSISVRARSPRRVGGGRPIHAPGGLRTASASRRGAVLPATLLVLVLGALAAMGALTLADAERASVAAALERSQTRALAWSGVQGAMAELAAQRAGILSGEAPSLTESWVLFETPSGRRAVARLLPIGTDGQLAVSESAKIDVNSAPVAVLARAIGLGEAGAADEAAAAIAAARRERAFSSVEELVGVAGLTASRVYGDVAGGGRERAGPPGDEPYPLADLLTAWSFDPNIQAGLGARGGAHEGELRVNINAPWSEALGRAIARRYDEPTAAAVERIMNEGREFKSEADIIATLRFFGVEPAQWVETLDVFTTCPDPFVAGRVDINLASKDVLACLPGIGADAAAALVDLRERLDRETLRSVAWPAIEGALTPDQYQEAVAHMTVRSAQWRVRVEAGYDEAEGTARRRSPGIADRPRARRTVEEEENPLQGRIALDAVIDIAAERPRVAYLRESTSLALALALAAAEPEMVDEEGGSGDGAEGSSAGLADSNGARSTGATRREVVNAGLGPTGEPAASNAARSSSEGSSGSLGGGRLPTQEPRPRESSADVAAPGAGEDNRRGRWTPTAALESSGETDLETGPDAAGSPSGSTGARP